MSTTFKRPMFRRGGNVGNGIMTGIRENFAEAGSTAERLAKIAAKYPSTAVDPLSQFLIQGGINLVGQPESGGGVLADAARAFKEPTGQLFAGLAKKGEMERDLAIQGEVLDIEKQIALAKGKKGYEAETRPSQFKFLIESYNEAGGLKKAQAENIANFRLNAIEQGKKYFDLAYIYNPKKSGANTYDVRSQYESDKSSVPDGAVFFDATTSRAFQRKGNEFIEIDQFTLRPIENVDGTE